MNPKLVSLRKTYDEKVALVKAAKAAMTEDATDEQVNAFGALVDEVTALDTSIKSLADADTKASGFALTMPYAPGEAPIPGPQDENQNKSIAELFLASPEYKTYREGHSDRFPKIAIKAGLVSFGVTGEGPGVGAISSIRFTGIEGLNRRAITIFDVISRSTTTSESHQYARMVGRTNNAASVPEIVEPVRLVSGEQGYPESNETFAARVAAAYALGVKPQSTFSYETVTASLVTVAHFCKVTRRSLKVIGQLRATISGELTDGLTEEFERQVLDGSGGIEFQGLTTVAGTLSQEFVTKAGATAVDNMFRTMRLAKAKLAGPLGHRTTNPNAWLINPSDLADIQLAQDTTGKYRSGGPFAAGDVPTVWNIAVVESELVQAGTCWLGDFRKIVVYDYGQSTISEGTEGNDFTSNLTNLLAEQDALLENRQPSAFCEVALTSEGS